MPTPPIDSLKEMIDKQGLNTFLNATPAVSKPVYVDSSSKLQAGAVPFSLPITPSSATVTFLNVTGAATSDVMTTNVVVDGAGGATTFTKKGYIKISITDTGDVMTDGDYYIQVGTLT